MGTNVTKKPTALEALEKAVNTRLFSLCNYIFTFVAWITCFDLFINLGHHQVPRLFLYLFCSLCKANIVFVFLAGILFCANTQCGTAIKIVCTLVKVLSFSFCLRFVVLKCLCGFSCPV